MNQAERYIDAIAAYLTKHGFDLSAAIVRNVNPGAVEAIVRAAARDELSNDR